MEISGFPPANQSYLQGVPRRICPARRNIGEDLLGALLEYNSNMLNFNDIGSLRGVCSNFYETESSVVVYKDLQDAILDLSDFLRAIVKDRENSLTSESREAINAIEVIRFNYLPKVKVGGLKLINMLIKDFKNLETNILSLLNNLDLNQTDLLWIAALFCSHGLFKVPVRINEMLPERNIAAVAAVNDAGELFQSLLSNRRDEKYAYEGKMLQAAGLLYIGKLDEAADFLPRLTHRYLFKRMSEFVADEYANAGMFKSALIIMGKVPFEPHHLDSFYKAYERICYDGFSCCEDDPIDNIQKHFTILPKSHHDSFLVGASMSYRKRVEGETGSNITQEMKVRWLRKSVDTIALVSDSKIRNPQIIKFCDDLHDKFRAVCPEDLEGEALLLFSDVEVGDLAKAYHTALLYDVRRPSESIASTLGKISNLEALKNEEFLFVWNKLSRKVFEGSLLLSERLHELDFIVNLVDTYLDDTKEVYSKLLWELDFFKASKFKDLSDSERKAFLAKESEIRAKIAAQESSNQDGQGFKVV